VLRNIYSLVTGRGLPPHTRDENPDPEIPVFRFIYIRSNPHSKEFICGTKQNISGTQNNKAGKNGQAHKWDLWIKAQNTKSGDKKISSIDKGKDFAKITVSLLVIYLSLIYIVKYLSSFGNPYSSKISGHFLLSKTTLLLSKTTLSPLKDHTSPLKDHAFSSQRPHFSSQRPHFLLSLLSKTTLLSTRKDHKK